MNFADPAWLFLLPALAVLAWQWPRLRLHRPLRVVCLVLLTLTLADLSWRIFEPGIDLWVLVDRSDSAAELLAPRLNEWEGLLRKSMGPHDRLKFIDFGDDAVVRPEDLNTVSEVATGETRIANALQLAVLRHEAGRATRFLLLSDGYPTEPLGDASELLAQANIPLDMRLVALGGGSDFEVAAIQAPNRVQAGEPFVLNIQMRVDGISAAAVPYEVERDGVVVAKGTANFERGQARVRLTDRLGQSGSAHYVARIFPQNDPVPGNNVAETWVESVAGPRVLVVSIYPQDPVAAALKAQGIEVDLETNPAALSEGRLSGARAVIIDNVPAHMISGDFQKSLEFFVHEQGGGLLMLGGKNSFGSGGYYGSRLDELLPVSMELKDEKRKLAVAMVVALDRSGSMRASVPTTDGTVREKIELADAGTAETLRLLGPRDLIGVFAVDTEAYNIVPLSTVEPDRATMIDNVLRIQSQGGGIVVPVALRASWDALKDVQVGQKHIIIFADANDALQSSEGMPAIVQEITDGGGTVSVIGLGHDTDSGADYLRDVARLGNGRIFFESDPNQLPGIFTQETVAVARSTFITDSTPLQPTAGWAELAAKSLDWMKNVDGYNLCYLQPKAGQAAISSDENVAPLVAFWQRGAGRTAAVTFPMAGPQSETVRAWPGYGDFITTLTRWLMGTSTPAGLGIKARLDGDQLIVDLFYDQTWDNETAKHFPQAIYTQDGMDHQQTLSWEHLEPGHFQSHARLKPGSPAIGVVQIGQYSLPFGPLAPGSDLEWLRDPVGPRALRALVAASGGKEITELSEAWRDIGRQHYLSLRPWLLALLVLFVLAEALATRIGVLASWRRKKSEETAGTQQTRSR